MIKFRKIKFNNHPVLGNILIDFCLNGKAIDTIIIAGENGCGKSTLLNEIYKLCTLNKTIINDDRMWFIEYVEYEDDGEIKCISFNFNNSTFYCKFSETEKYYNMSAEFAKHFKAKCIYSDIGINYKIDQIKSTTFLDIDKSMDSRKSTNSSAQEIAQLFVDVINSDNSDFVQEYKKFKETGLDTNNIGDSLHLRMERFKRAFEYMFGEDLTLDGIAKEQSIKVNFKNAKGFVSLENLSSGEKQIVFRGGYLLKDVNALQGALVLIDEPEISMHPVWQKKILNFYKLIFTDKEGVQTSQIFTVTHSPFIIHNDNRYNDKIIIMQKDAEGKIKVKDKPEFYCSNSIAVVEEAFNINDLDKDSQCPVVYLEGRTDETYFKKAYEIFGFSFPVVFKSIGKNTNDSAKGTGSGALKNAYKFLSNFELKNTTIILYDCDVVVERKDENKLHVLKMDDYEEDSIFDRGIEKLLNLPKDFDYTSYIKVDIHKKNGLENVSRDWNKTKLASYICSLEIEKTRRILKNLKTEIEKIKEIIDNN